jgi:hypothetical protein
MRGRCCVATNLGLDDRLIDEARRVGKHRTKKEAVTAALQEYVRRRKQLRILDLFGTIDFDPAYDYKAERRRDGKRLPGRGAAERGAGRRVEKRRRGAA